jgi:hypothetical protein
MGGALRTIGLAIGVTFSVRAIINFGKQAVTAFADAEAAAASLKNTVSNMGGTDVQATGLQSWVDSMEKMSGFTGDELSKALETLIVQTGSGAKAQQAMSVAMDIAAAKGISLAEAGNKVYLVMTGMTRTMKEFGMKTRDGATDMDYLKTLGEKMAGGLSTNLDTMSGKLRITTDAVHGLKEAFGQALAASVTSGAGWIANMLNGISQFMSTQSIFGAIFGTSIFNTDRKLMNELGNKYGQEWLAGYANALSGKTQEHDVGFAASLPAPTAFTSIAPTIVGAITTAGTTAAATIKDAFKASWSPITLMGGNLPELTKYIGNLRSVSATTIHHKVAVDVQMTVTSGSVVVKNTTPVAKAIVKAIVPAVQAAITHGAGWTPPTLGIGFSGGLGNGFQFGGD